MVSAITSPYPALSPDIPSNTLIALLTKYKLIKFIKRYRSKKSLDIDKINTQNSVTNLKF